MIGDDRRRMCGQCDKQVYNLSGMTRDEAQALLIEKEGKLCARFFQRADGTILLADCVVGKQQKRKRLVVIAGASALLAGGVVAYGMTRTHQVPITHAHIKHVQPRPVEPPPPPHVDPRPLPPEDFTEVAGGISAEPLPPPPPKSHVTKAPHK
jgi:hypothetical protein